MMNVFPFTRIPFIIRQIRDTMCLQKPVHFLYKLLLSSSVLGNKNFLICTSTSKQVTVNLANANFECYLRWVMLYRLLELTGEQGRV